MRHAGDAQLARSVRDRAGEEGRWRSARLWRRVV